MGNPLPSEVARTMATQRAKVETECSVCGVRFVGLQTRRFCSNACRQRSYYSAHRDEERGRQWKRYQLKAARKRLLTALEPSSLRAEDLDAIIEWLRSELADGEWHAVSTLQLLGRALFRPEVACRAYLDAKGIDRPRDLAVAVEKGQEIIIQTILEATDCQRLGTKKDAVFRLQPRSILMTLPLGQ